MTQYSFTSQSARVVAGNNLVSVGTEFKGKDSLLVEGKQDRKFYSATDSHTGLYLGQDAQGIYLLHQWRNPPPTISKVKWESWNGNTYEAGGQYKVISK